MQKRTAITAEDAATANISAAKFHASLEQEKKGVRFVYTLSRANLESLQLPKALFIELMNKTCFLPTQEPMTTVQKVLEVEIEMDLRKPQQPPVITAPALKWNPAPASRHERLSGPPDGFRTDYIIYQKMRVQRVWNTAPFIPILCSNLHNFYTRMVRALSETSSGNTKAVFPEFETALLKKDGKGYVRSGLKVVIPPCTKPEGLEIPAASGEITEFLKGAQEHTSALSFYAAERERLERGMVHFPWKHPVSGELVDFVAMSCGHIVFTHAVQNWSEWQLQIGPLVAASAQQETFTVFMEKSLAGELITYLHEKLSRKSFAVPSDRIVFGVGRRDQLVPSEDAPPGYEVEHWRFQQGCEPANADLNGRFLVRAQIVLTYALLPAEEPRALFDCGSAEYAAHFNNEKLLAEELAERARNETNAELMEFSFTKLKLEDEVVVEQESSTEQT